MKAIRIWMGKHSYLLRLILLIFIVLCVPFSIISVRYAQITYQKLYSYNKEDFHATAAYAAENYNTLISDISSLTYKIRSDYKKQVSNHLGLSYIEAHPYHRYEAVQLLSDYQLMLPSASRLGLYYRNTDYIVTSTACYNLPMYANSLTSASQAFSGTILTEIEALLDNDFDSEVSLYSTFPLQSDEGTLLIIQPTLISYGIGMGPNAVILYEFDSESLSRYFGISHSTLYDLSIFQGNSLLWSSSKFDFSFLNDRAFLNCLESESEFCSWEHNGIPYSASFFSSNGLKFVVTESETDLQHDFNDYVRSTNRTLILMIAAFTVVSLSTILMIYQPVRKLTHNIHTGSDGKVVNVSDENTGEFDQIWSTFESLRSENIRISYEAAERSHAITELIFDGILSGHSIPDASVFHRFGFSNEWKHYLVIVVAGSGFNTAQQEILSQLLEKSLKASVFISAASQQNCVILVLASKNSFSPLSSISINLTNALNHVLPTMSSFGIGCETDDISRLRQSYIHAMNELRFIHESFPAAQPVISANIDSFLQILQLGNSEDADKKLSEFFSETVLSNSDEIERRFCCYKFINEFFSFLNQKGIALAPAAFYRIIGFSSPCELLDILHDQIPYLCSIINMGSHKRESMLREQMIEYVDNHFSDPALTLTELAGAFDMTLYTCSKTFKELIGIGFKEYVNTKRLEYARELITSTDKSIGEIAENCGFSSASYFINRFKSVYGVSPGTLRDI